MREWERERTGLEWHECEKVTDDSFWVNYSFEFLFQWFILVHIWHFSFFVNFCLKFLFQYSLVLNGFPLEHVIFLLFASVGNYYPGHRAVLPRVSAEVFPCWRDGYCGQGLGWNARQTLVLQVELQDIHYSCIKLQPNPLQHCWAFILYTIEWTRSSGLTGIKIWGS